MTGIICYSFMQILRLSHNIFCVEYREIFYLFCFLNIKFAYSVWPNQGMSKELKASVLSRQPGTSLQGNLLLSGPALIPPSSAKFFSIDSNCRTAASYTSSSLKLEINVLSFVDWDNNIIFPSASSK